MYVRKAGDWIDTYLNWSLDRSEVKATQLVWAGLFALSAVLKRKVKIPAIIMGEYDIHPNLYVIFVADPGKTRKSSTMGFCMSLLRDLNLMLPNNSRERVNLASDTVSQSAMVQNMSNTHDGSMCITASELGSFMIVGGEAMYNFMTHIFDNPRSYEYRTRAHKLEIVNNPSVCFFAATTPTWMQDNMPPHVIGGGFASRTIFVYEDSLRQRQLYYSHLDRDKYEKMRQDLVADLVHLTQLEGEFKHDSPRTQSMMEAWYRDVASTPADDPRLVGYFERKPLHIHKLCMLLSVAESDRLQITESHFDKALKLLDEVEKKMARTFLAVGMNTQAGLIVRLSDYIGTQGGVVDLQTLAGKFFHDCSGDELKEALADMCLMGTVRIEPHPDNPNFRLIQGL
jgi:hypothetical protein